MADLDPITNPTSNTPETNSNPSPMSTGPVGSSGPGNKSSKRSLIIAGVVIIVAIILVIVAVAMMQKKPGDTGTNNNTNGTSQSEDLLEQSPYVSSEHGFSIQYPKGWQAADQPDQGNYLTIVSPQEDTVNGIKYQARVNVSYEPTSDDLNSYVSAAIDVLPTVLNDFVVAENKDITVNNMPAKELHYTATDPDGTPITMHQVILIHDSKAYTVTGLTATEKWNTYGSAIEASARSIKLL